MTTATPPEGNAQLALLRIICCVAWADGDLADQERTLLEQLVERYFPEQQQNQEGRAALRQLTTWAVDLDGLEGAVRRLTNQEDRRLALKLAYLMANVHQGPADSSPINSQEKSAYRRLVECLGLGEQEVQEIEWAASQELAQARAQEQGPGGIWRRILGGLGAWPSQEMLESPGMSWL